MMTWYKFLREDNKKLKKKYRRGGYGAREGKALKGSTFGPANEGKSLSPEEIHKATEDFKARGLI